MNEYDDRDVLAAVAAVQIYRPNALGRNVNVSDARYLVGAEYDGDVDDNVDRLIKRGLLEPAVTRNLDGEPLGEFETPPVVRLTEAGWYELWRR